MLYSRRSRVEILNIFAALLKAGLYLSKIYNFDEEIVDFLNEVITCVLVYTL